jgi:hypothetical protein
MIINIRYHIFTITAIFAALGLGILIGSSIIGNETLIEKQKSIIDNIGNEIERLRDENLGLQTDFSQLQDRIKYRNELEERVLPLILKKELGNKYYLMLITENSGQTQTELNSYFRTTGANIAIFSEPGKLLNTASEKQSYYKIILWNNNGKDSSLITGLQKELNQEEFLVYSGDDVIGLMLVMLEDELNESRKNDHSHNSSL